MAKREDSGKVSRYPGDLSFLNIGTILFGAIFIYILISLFIYLTADHATSYEVTSGSISGNYRYNAVALKEESVINAEYGGIVTYYARNGARCSSGMTVCSVDEHGEGYSAATNHRLTEDEMEQMRQSMASFSLHFDDSSYQEVYNFKADLENVMLQAASTQDEMVSSYLINEMKAPASGFILYAVDGMEGLTDKDLTTDLFNMKNYHAGNLRMGSSVKVGDPVFKLITSEDWALCFPLSRELATELQDRTTMRFRFLRDNTTFSAGFSIVENDGDYFGKLSLHNSLARYVSDRFMEIELLMDKKTGLKIPNSAVSQKSFYRIPEDYVVKNPDSTKEVSLIRETFLKDGSSEVRYITTQVYDKQEGFYLISTDVLKSGDYVQMEDTTKKHQVTDSDLTEIAGVYNINKGYAVFRQVTVIDQNEEFCIVLPNQTYGLAPHDFIVLDASRVDPDDII